jgi:hypothetical protein
MIVFTAFLVWPRSFGTLAKANSLCYQTALCATRAMSSGLVQGADIKTFP